MTRRALLIGVPGGDIHVDLAVQRLTPLLTRLGFTSIVACVGPRATRPGMLAALDRLLADTVDGDAVFLHYFGHGGRVQFSDRADDTIHGYITCTRTLRGSFEAILDHELSTYASALDARCGNVTVMLDCCFSAEIVRATEDPAAPPPNFRREPTPAWLTPLPAHVDLALDSHPRILRLCGASPKRTAFAVTRGGRHIGALTEAFINAIDEVGPAWPRLCWATLGHRLREHVVTTLNMEGQWVALAGPSTRRLFIKDSVELPGTVTFTPGDVPGRGWLRAGWHQGLAVGDRWALVDPCITADGTLEHRATLEVTSVGRNRSEVSLDTTDPQRPGTPAVLLSLRERVPVTTDDPDLQRALTRSAWCRPATSSDPALLHVRRDHDTWIVTSPDHPNIHLRTLDHTLALLDDRARVHTLLRRLAAHAPTDGAPTWQWSPADAPDRPHPLTGAIFTVGDRVRVDLTLAADAPPFNWFASVVLIDPAGRPRLLTTRMPEGIELAPGDREVVGVRPGRRGVQGFDLRWPADVAGDEAPASLLLLTSRRPIELAHLVRAQPHDEDDALALQGLAGDTMRQIIKPEHTRGCAWARIDFRLRR